MDIQAIHNEAKTAAIQAENAYLSQHGEPLYCGFAWVDVFVARTNSKEAKELLKVAVTKSVANVVSNDDVKLFIEIL